MKFFKGITVVTYIYLVFWAFYQYSFMRGYEDAKNDFSKQGYDFSNTTRAFR